MAAAGLARSRAAMDINIPVAASLTASRAPARRRVPREAIAAKAHVDNELRPRAGQQQLGRRGANRDGEQEDDASVPRLGSNTILYRLVPREGRGEAEAEKPGLGLKGLLAARASAKRATSSEGLQHKLASLGAALALAGLVTFGQSAVALLGRLSLFSIDEVDHAIYFLLAFYVVNAVVGGPPPDGME